MLQDFSISFENPWLLLWLLLIPALVFLSVRSLTGLERGRRILAIATRAIVTLLIVCCLAGIQYVRSNRDLTVIFAIDRSKSIPDDPDGGLQVRQENYIRQVAKQMRKDDRLGIIAFDGDAYVEQRPMRGGMHLSTLPPTGMRDRTDISKAIRLAMAVFPRETAKRVVLMTDGNENVGNLLEEVAAASGAGVAIDVLPTFYAHRQEVLFDRMSAPPVAHLEEQIRPRMVLEAKKPTRGRIQFEHNGRLVDLDPDSDEFGVPVTLKAGKNVFWAKVLLTEGGPHRFQARFIPDNDADDAILQNNTATAFTFVHTKAKALLLTDDPTEDEILHRELLRNKVDVDMRTLDQVSVDPMSLMKYHTVILSNLPANRFTDEQQKSLATYMKDLGNGLIMTGGPESFGAGGWIGSPVEEVMPVTFEIKHRRVIPRGALVLIMHSCEMARANYWGERVAIKALDTISSRDYIGVLAFVWSSGVNWEVPLQLATNKSAIAAKIKKVQIGDMPDFATTMNLALQALQGTDAAQKHIIIISDGDPQPPQTTTLAAMKQAKITCSTVGIGYGAHVMEPTMRMIARQTGGTFYPCRNPRKLPQIFAKEAKVVRRPLISEEPFKPRLVYGLSEAIAGVKEDEIPLLGGIVLTSPKPLVEMPLARVSVDGKDPLLAHWRYGLGKSAAFTSGYWKHWGTQWTEWEKFGKLWAQIVRWSMRPEQSPNIDVFTRLEGEQGRIVVDALDKDASFLNFLRVRAIAVSPDQEAQPLPFVQTGPGRYEAEFDVKQMGQYIAHLNFVGKDGKDEGRVLAGLSVPYSPEYRQLVTNEALIEQIRETTGGRILEMNPEKDDVFSHDLPPAVSKQAVWEWVVAWLILPLFLLDVAGRRLASSIGISVVVEVLLAVTLLFGMGLAYMTWWGALGVLILCELVGWSIRWRTIRPTIDFLIHPVVVLGRAGERSKAALERLKATRERVRDQMTSDQEAGDVPGRRPVEPVSGTGEAVDRQRRFDVGDARGGQPAGDLEEAVGGASVELRKEQERAAAEKKEQAAETEDKDSMTSRLLDARKRAREKLDHTEETNKDDSSQQT